MKVLFVSHSNDLSGANKSFLDIIINLRHKIDIVVLCNSKDGALTEALNKIQVKVVIADYAWWYISPRNNPIKQLYHIVTDSLAYRRKKISKEIIQILDNECFDLVYTNTSTIDVGAYISYKLKLPHVWHIREFGKEDFGFIPIISNSKQKKVFLSANKIIVNSKALGNKYRDFIPEYKIEIVYNGFNIDELECLHTRRRDGVLRILISGQVCEAKGQEQAIMAVQKLQKEGKNIHLYIAGAINSSYLNSILKHIGGKKDWLHILGQCSDMKNVRADMDIELVCSKCEAFGRVTIEAMLNEIPVIGSDSGGTSELIKDHITGLLYENGNIEQLSNCILELMENEGLYYSVARNAKEMARNFTINSTSKAVYNIFTEFVNLIETKENERCGKL